MKGIKKLCLNARAKTSSRMEVILCGASKGKGTDGYSIPFLSDGQVCVATTFYSTGHSSPDAYVTTGEICKCPYRKVKT